MLGGRSRWIVFGLGALMMFGVGVYAFPIRHQKPAAIEGAAELAALGYVEWAEVGDGPVHSGVVKHLADATPGLTLYKSRPAPTAHLIDLDGNVLHTWTAPRLDVEDWESFVSFFCRRGSDVTWDHIEVQANGDLIASVQGRHLERISWRSELIWRARIPAHHDFDLASDGTIVTLTRRNATLDTEHGPVPIVDNASAFLSGDGELERELSLRSILGSRVPEERIAAIRRANAGGEKLDAKALVKLQDVFHANSVELLRRDVAGLGRTGQLLLSVAALDLITVVDPETGEIVWEWGPGELDHQHHPSVLPNGHVLVFDNGRRRGYSRILEVDPSNGDIVWSYSGTPREDFFTATRGSVQQLPGDRYLIAHSDSGHAFEIDRSGRVLWEFFNPDVDPRKDRRGPFYRIERLTPQRVASLPWGSGRAPALD